MARTIARKNTKRGIAARQLADDRRASRSPAAPADRPATRRAGDTLKLWHYEGADSAMGKAWAEAIKVFEEETGATVEFEEKSFEQIQKTASQVLDSDAAPDLMEFNKGNATAGFLASTGLITDISDAVDEYGWADKLAPSLQTTAKYSEDGVMGGDTWYGIPNYGEFVGVYYNQDAFAAAGLEIPTTYDEFVDVLDAFVAQGITPLAEAGAEYPLGQLWYQLALSAGRPPVRQRLPALREPRRLAGRRGHLRDRDAPGVRRQGLHRLGRLVGQGRGRGCLVHQRHRADLRVGLVVVRTLRRARRPASTGRCRPSPTRSSRSARRATCGSCPRTRRTRSSRTSSSTSRCVPRSRRSSATTAASPSPPTPPTSPTRRAQELIATFNGILDNDGLSFYPDWPAAGFYDVHRPASCRVS